MEYDGMSFLMLLNRLTAEDIDFANDCGISFVLYVLQSTPIRIIKIPTISKVLNQTNENDSGWVDASTNNRLITELDRIVYMCSSKEEYLMLKLKYDSSIVKLTDSKITELTSLET